MDSNKVGKEGKNYGFIQPGEALVKPAFPIDDAGPDQNLNNEPWLFINRIYLCRFEHGVLAATKASKRVSRLIFNHRQNQYDHGEFVDLLEEVLRYGSGDKKPYHLIVYTPKQSLCQYRRRS